MTYALDFENDIFVSYAHIDNRASNWITSLTADLQNLVSEAVGSDVTVWRDVKLTGNDLFDDEITKKVRGSAIFLPIISPRYVQSDSCLKECRAFVSSPNLRIANSSRIHRVNKLPLHQGLAEPPELSPDKTLGFRFFEETEAGQREFDNRAPMPTYPQFWQMAKRLAGAVAKTLMLIRNDPRPRNQKRTVFLADVSSSLRTWREELKRELTGRGHRVAPESALLSEGVFDAALAESAVASASLSIHLFGDTYGAVPEGEERSVPHLEYALAAGRKLRQLVWIPPDTTQPPSDAKMAALLNAIMQGSSQAGPSVEVCKTPFESFKEVVLDEVSQEYIPTGAGTQCKSVYLLCHDDDSSNADLQLLRKHLLDAGYPVNLPVFEAPPEELRMLEEQSFIDNDATVIFYGDAKDSWVDQKRKFLLSALGRIQRGERNRRAVCLRPPSTKSKQLTFGPYAGGKEIPEAKGFSPLFVVGDFEAFSQDKLLPLIDWLAK
jgi:TIR domain